MATATSTYIPIELYLKSEHEPAAEYVDGVIEKRAVPELDHAVWQDAIQAWFRLHKEEWKTLCVAELRVQVAQTRFRIPDVAVLDRSLATEQTITIPLLAVFEILSPEDTFTRALRNLADYEAMGIGQIWLIDSEARTYYRFAGGVLAIATHFGAPGDRIHFAMSEVEALLP
jgi:Uma2 family endonuclease